MFKPLKLQVVLCAWLHIGGSGRCSAHSDTLASTFVDILRKSQSNSIACYSKNIFMLFSSLAYAALSSYKMPASKICHYRLMSAHPFWPLTGHLTTSKLSTGFQFVGASISRHPLRLILTRPFPLTIYLRGSVWFVVFGTVLLRHSKDNPVRWRQFGAICWRLIFTRTLAMALYHTVMRNYIDIPMIDVLTYTATRRNISEDFWSLGWHESQTKYRFLTMSSNKLISW